MNTLDSNASVANPTPVSGKSANGAGCALFNNANSASGCGSSSTWLNAARALSSFGHGVSRPAFDKP
ncbi:hypothetical protein D3C85_1919110 [compost metagenome]